MTNIWDRIIDPDPYMDLAKIIAGNGRVDAESAIEIAHRIVADGSLHRWLVKRLHEGWESSEESTEVYADRLLGRMPEGTDSTGRLR